MIKLESLTSDHDKKDIDNLLNTLENVICENIHNKNIVVGITGNIAAYKAADLVSKLKKAGANIKVVMTKSSTSFITERTF